MPSVAAPEPAPPGDVLTSSCPRAKPAVRHASSTATTASTPRPPIPEEVIRRRAPLPPVEEADSPSSSEPTTAGVLSDETRTFEPPAVSLTQQQLSLLYAYTNPRRPNPPSQLLQRASRSPTWTSWPATPQKGNSRGSSRR
jgi:hypothetical protein